MIVTQQYNMCLLALCAQGAMLHFKFRDRDIEKY